jgi:hypothetical protein
MIGKYCNRKYNLALESNSIQLGTVDLYRNQNINSGTFDDEEGIILYKIKDSIHLTSEISKNYFDNAIQIWGDNGPTIDKCFFDTELPIIISNGDLGLVKLNGDSTNLIKIDLTSFYYIFSTTFTEDSPSIKTANEIDNSYDSFYQILDPELLSRTIAHKLINEVNNGRLLLESKNYSIGDQKINVNYQCGMVNYDISKIEEMSQNNDSKLTFKDRLLKSIFNKNTKHNHNYQNEFRFVFWFTDSNSELLKLPSNKSYILNLDSIDDLFVNIELTKHN